MAKYHRTSTDLEECAYCTHHVVSTLPKHYLFVVCNSTIRMAIIRMVLPRSCLRSACLSLPRAIFSSAKSENATFRLFRSFSTGKKQNEEEKNSNTDESSSNGIARRRDELQRIRDELPVTFADISRAHVAIRDGVVRTRAEKSYFLSEVVGANIYIKPEFRQFTGSFKERGARNAILQMKREHSQNLKGVIAASAGNHALALAYHGKQLDVPVTVVMPTVAPLAKVDKCRVRSVP